MAILYLNFQHGHSVFKFRHELKYLTESLGVTFTVELPLALNRATQSTECEIQCQAVHG